jgi:hypothetical protein
MRVAMPLFHSRATGLLVWWNADNVDVDCPVFDGLFRYCQLYTGGSICTRQSLPFHTVLDAFACVSMLFLSLSHWVFVTHFSFFRLAGFLFFFFLFFSLCGCVFVCLGSALCDASLDGMGSWGVQIEHWHGGCRSELGGWFTSCQEEVNTHCCVAVLGYLRLIFKYRRCCCRRRPPQHCCHFNFLIVVC